MSIFDGTTKTPSGKRTSSSDSTLPRPARLSWLQIAAATAVAGTTGAHCELIHGNRSQQTKGMIECHISGHQHFTVQDDQKISIGGNHRETIAGHCYQNFVGPHLVTNQTVRNETRMGKCTITYGLHTREDDHDGKMFYADELYEAVEISNTEVATAKVSIQPLHIEVKGIHVYRSIVQPFAPAIDVAEKLHKAKEAQALAKLTALRANIEDLKFDVNITNTQLNSGLVVPLDPNGTPLL